MRELAIRIADGVHQPRSVLRMAREHHWNRLAILDARGAPWNKAEGGSDEATRFVSSKPASAAVDEMAETVPQPVNPVAAPAPMSARSVAVPSSSSSSSSGSALPSARGMDESEPNPSAEPVIEAAQDPMDQSKTEARGSQWTESGDEKRPRWSPVPPLPIGAVFEEPGCLIPELSSGGIKVTTTSDELLANIDR